MQAKFRSFSLFRLYEEVEFIVAQPLKYYFEDLDLVVVPKRYKFPKVITGEGRIIDTFLLRLDEYDLTRIFVFYRQIYPPRKSNGGRYS